MPEDSEPVKAIAGPEPRPSNPFGPSTIGPDGRVPLRENVPSSSQMPAGVSPQSQPQFQASAVDKEMVKSVLEYQREMIERQHVTNDSLCKQMETQRNLFDAERALWLSTKAVLNEKIFQVQAQLRQVSSTDSTARASPTRAPISVQTGRPWMPTGSNDGSRRASLGGIPFWGYTPGHARSSVTRETSGALPEGFSDAAAISTGLGCLSTADESSKNTENEPLRPKGRITVRENTDPILKDAGHTPMARRSMSISVYADGSAATTGNDGGSSPKTGKDHLSLDSEGKKQYPVRQPRQPSECQGSYFSSVVAPVDRAADVKRQDIEIDTPPEDLPLEGPLGLTNSPDNERNMVFLGELEKKLLTIDASATAGESQAPMASLPPPPSSDIAKQMQNADGTAFEIPESEPPLRLRKKDRNTIEEEESAQPLRIKTSQNFGSALGQGGEVDYGKGFPGRQP